ncbi:MAG: hypothetical protein K0B87_03715, partial [Candidatus Syntrophosphaera sp.]|nr:hypothetical protein [Candidatus Syntrophosphaera sp.]
YNELLGSIARNLSTLYAAASVDYKADLKSYSQRNGSQNVPKTKLPPTAYAIFIKLMYAWQKADSEHVDLASLTASDIGTVGLGVVDTLKAAIDNDLLDSLSDYDDLTGVF